MAEWAAIAISLRMLFTDDAERIATLARINRTFYDHIPFNQAVGMELLELGDRRAKLRLPWREDLVGNPETGVFHGGALTALLDSACGSAAFMSIPEPMALATLDLRIDYLKPATPRRAVIGEARCYKTTRSVAFVRCTAYHDEGDVIATGTGSFMLGTPIGIGGS